MGRMVKERKKKKKNLLLKLVPSSFFFVATNSRTFRKKLQENAEQDVLYFGVASEKNVHLVLRFDLRAMGLTIREPEKGTINCTLPFISFSKIKTDRSSNLLQLELKGADASPLPWSCYNEFDFDAISTLSQKIISNSSDLISFSNSLKPQICFVQGQAFLNKKRVANSEVRFILVERTVIIHPPMEESSPLYLVPLWKRPCFTVGKTGVRFDMKKKSVDVFFASSEIRDNYFNVIGIAATKTPADSIPLRQKLESLVQLNETVFQPHNPHHFDFAQRLWDATIARYHPGEKMPSTCESPLWKELGCTTTSLALDLKVCNMLGLMNLLYYAEMYPDDLDEIVKKQSESNFPVLPCLARISFMFFSLLNLGKKQSTWYPTFVTYPMWTYDIEAFELLVCIGLRLFNKKWESSVDKNQSACMNDLVADLTDTLSRPASEEGVPYVFSMFLVLLSKKAVYEEPKVYTLPKQDESETLTVDKESETYVNPLAFATKGFLSVWMTADKARQDIMLTNDLPLQTVDTKVAMARRAEKKKLENKWENTKGVRNEFKDKYICLICDRRKRKVIVLPCSHLVLCRECVVEGMICPQCKQYVHGFVEIVSKDTNAFQTLR